MLSVSKFEDFINATHFRCYNYYINTKFTLKIYNLLPEGALCILFTQNFTKYANMYFFYVGVQLLAAGNLFERKLKNPNFRIYKALV